MLAIITCHFNFAGYNRPRQNLHRFVTQLKSFGYPVFGVEAHLHYQRPYTDKWDGWRQIAVETDQIMFQKEALLNVAAESVPIEFDKIAWIDADLWFDNLEWFKLTDKLLDRFKVLQLFEHCHYTAENGGVFRTDKAFVNDQDKGHPGFAWAARRELWRDLDGLYPKAIHGCGDDLAARAFVGKLTLKHGSAGSNANEYRTWQKRVSSWVNGQYSFVPGSVYHEWHGNMSNRGYSTRRDMAEHIDFGTVTIRADNGLLKWSQCASSGLRIAIYNYFLHRKEDG